MHGTRSIVRAVRASSAVAHDARPRDVRRDHRALVGREQAPRTARRSARRRTPSCAGSCSGTCWPRRRRAPRRRRTSARALVRAREDVVDEHAAVDAGRSPRPRPQSAPPSNSRSRGSQTIVGTPSAVKRVLQDLELAPGRHVAPVDDRDASAATPCRPTRGSSPAARRASASIERVEPRRRSARGSAPSTGSRSNSSASRSRVAEPGRRLGVVLGELQRVGQQERVERATPCSPLA